MVTTQKHHQIYGNIIETNQFEIDPLIHLNSFQK